MIRIQLPQAEADRLEKLFQATNDRKLRDRLRIVLMAQRGHNSWDRAYGTPDLFRWLLIQHKK